MPINKQKKKKTYSNSPIRPIEKSDRIVSNKAWLKGKSNLRKSWDIKLGDLVIVLWGDDKGKTGKVQRVFPMEGKVIVEGINIKTNYKKAQNGETGAINLLESPVWIWQVALAVKDPKNPEKLIASRIKKIVKNDKKVRIAVKTGETIE